MNKRKYELCKKLDAVFAVRGVPKEEIHCIKIKKPKPKSSAKTLFKRFKKECWRLTNLQDLSNLDHIEKRGFDNYHLDHKISIKRGCKMGLSPCFLAGIHNLRMIPYKENMHKNTKCYFG